MTDTGPTVSVVIPAYRAEAFIARAIQSVLDQPGVDPEIIVVVDGLVDRTADIAKDSPKTQVLINEVNQGAPAARNRGLALAKAPYVMFLDADDWVEGPLLQGLVEALDMFHADIAFGPCRWQFESGQPSFTASLHARSDERYSEINNRTLIKFFLMDMFIHPCSTLWKTDFVGEHGGWNETLVKHQDFEIVHRCLIRGAKVALTESGCGVYYISNSIHRITSSKAEARWESEVRAIYFVVNEAKLWGCLDNGMKEAFISYMRRHMRVWARNASLDSYRKARNLFEELGGRQQHAGSFANRVGCFLLGLRRKEQLALRVACLQKSTDNWRFKKLTRSVNQF